MAESILKIHTQNGDIPVGYPGLADKPVADKTLTIDGAFADAKTVGDKFAEAEETVSQLNQDIDDKTSQLKEDIDNLYSSKISKFYATNNGENHLADSDNGKIADMKLYGRSEQKQYSGRNLMPNFDDFETTVSGVSIKAKNGIITLEGNSIATILYSIPLKETITLPDENIYVHLRNNAELVGSSFVFKNENGQVDFASISSINRVLLMSPLTGQPISEIMLSLGEGIALKDFKMQPSLELTDEATAYEPYTGRQPSPSPDYPQEIKSVVNPTVKVCGSNIYDYENAKLTNTVLNGEGIENTASGYYTSDYIPVLNGIYVKGNNNNNNKLDPLRIGLYTEKNEWKIRKDITSTTLHVSSSDAKFIRLSYSKGDVAEIYVSYANIFEPYHEQTVTLPYTLNAIPVESGGNVAIDGQQYIADYVDVERGKLVRCVGVANQDTFATADWSNSGTIVIFDSSTKNVSNEEGHCMVTISGKFEANWVSKDEIYHFTQPRAQTLVIVLPKTVTTVEQGEAIRTNGFKFYYELATPTETDLTPEEITAFKALATYYPVTNISITSEQLDGYTVFNYPISMENGWNYVKQQLNDNRDYIYGMGTKTQDIDTQSAEAYVNSEYAVALTELEV